MDSEDETLLVDSAGPHTFTGNIMLGLFLSFAAFGLFVLGELAAPPEWRATCVGAAIGTAVIAVSSTYTR